MLGSGLPVLLVLACPRPAHPQAVAAGAFLRLDPNARTAALAGAATAIADDSGALLVNPAALSLIKKPELGATRVTLFEDTFFDALTFAFSTRRWGSFAGGYVRQASGGFERRAGPNDASSSFSVEQTAVLAGWGYSPRLPGEAEEEGGRLLSIGAAAKSVREKIDAASASGNGLDAGLLIRPRPALAIGVRAQNLVAPRPVFLSGGSAYARALDVSPAYARSFGDWRLLLAAKLSRVEGEGTDASGGVELQYGRFAAIRLGAQERGPSTGFGVALGNARIDYAALLHDLGLSHSVTLSARFGLTQEELEETIRRGISRLGAGEARRLAKAYLQKAERELRANRTAEARRSIEAASLLDPGNALVAARLQQADALWEEALRRQTVERLAALAVQQRELGNLLVARQYWRSVLDFDNSDQRARHELERIDAALSIEERARSESLGQAQQANDIALALAGAATYLARGMLRSARLEAEKIRRRYPENPQIRDFLAQTGRQLQAFTQARLSEAEKAIAARDYASALTALEGARRENPEDLELARRAAAARGELRGTVSAADRKQAEQMYYRAVEQYLKGSYDTAGGYVDEVLRLDASSEAGRALKEKVEAARRYLK